MKEPKHVPIHRANQRGAAVFVVMMTILVVTSLGSWAIYSASLTSAGSGHQRSAAQALYTSEMGILATTGYFSIPGFANANYVQAQNDLANGSPDTCLSVSASKFCKSIYMEDIDSTINLESGTFGATESILEQSTSEGSMGPYAATDASALQGHFFIEMTDPRPVMVPGTDVSSGTYQRVTLTSLGTVRPFNATLCSAQQNASAAQMGMRAHAVIGPLDP